MDGQAPGGANRKAAEDAADRKAARDATLAGIFEPTGALAAYLHAKRTAERLRRAARDGRLSQAATSAAMPLGLRAPLVVAVALVALLAVIGVGGTLLGWAAPSATARAVEAARGFLGALGLPGKTPRLPAARDMAAYWAGRGVADRGVVFAGAADASALLSLALLPLMVPPLWVTAVRRRSASFAPPDPETLRRGRLFGAGMAAFSVLLIWHGAHLLIHGDLDSARAGAGHFSASFFAPVWWALMALGVPGMAAALPSLVVRYVIRLWAR